METIFQLGPQERKMFNAHPLGKHMKSEELQDMAIGTEHLYQDMLGGWITMAGNQRY